MNIKAGEDGKATVNFNLPTDARYRTLLLEVTAAKEPYRQFIHIPAPDQDFDVSFYPEGGSLMQGAFCKVAFKAIQSNGRSTEVSGVIVDQDGREIGAIKTDHLGMGHFLLLAEKGKSYYAVCRNSQGQSKRFELPTAVNHGFALVARQLRDQIYVSVQKPVGITQNDELYLLAHTRGIVHLIEHLDREKNLAVIPIEIFPSGVLHLILFDAGLHPVSERLVFIHHRDQAQVAYSTDKESYTKRAFVKNNVTVTDRDGRPLAGNFSVFVTSDREVQPDSTANILTQLLLTSDLRGHLENPAGYFKNTPQSVHALDLLMCTQGWRRYNAAEFTQGRFSNPAFPLELGSEISGAVKSVLLGRPVEGVEVTAMSFTGGYFNSAHTDREGRFYLPAKELPDSTQFIVSAEPKRGMTRVDLVLDKEPFPERTIPMDHRP